MRYYSLILFLLSSLISYSQSINGIVLDGKTKDPISQASVRILAPKDSAYITGTATSDNGKFALNLSQGEYILEISYLSYIKYSQSLQLSDKKQTIDLGVISLKETNIRLTEALIVSTTPAIFVKGDTIEYNATAYTVEEGAMLKDIIKKIPGIEINAAGQLIANGKPITKILVDGKEFFGNNLRIALENLPASMIKKLQLFKEESEISKITGFKSNANNEQVLNLVVKDELKQSMFGDMRAGYGTDNRYANQFNGNYLIDETLYSAIGNINNVTDDFEYSAGSSQYDGITKRQDLGFSFSSQRSKSLKVDGEALYEYNNNLYELDSSTRSFISSGDRMSIQSSSTESISKKLSGSLRLRWTPDSLTTAAAQLKMVTSNNDDINKSSSKSYQIGSKDTTSGWSDYNTNNNLFNLYASFMIGRKLNKKGRNISMSVDGTLRGGNSTGTNLSRTAYQGLSVTKYLDQELDITNRMNNWNVSISYVEPLGKNNSIMLTYNMMKDYTASDRNTYRRDGEGEYTVIDPSYTRNSKVDNETQLFSAVFQSVKDKLEYSVGVNINPLASKSKVLIVDSIIEDQTQKVVNWSPTFRLTYKPSNSSSFDFSYSGNTEQPTLKQLSTDTIIINPLYQSYGNPNLRSSYTNNVSLYFLKSDYGKGSFLSLSTGGSYVVDKIVDYTITDEQGNTKSTQQNVNGNWSGNFDFTFSTPLKNKKINVSNTIYSYYYRQIGFSNGLKNTTHTLTSGQSFRIGYSSDNFDQILLTSFSYTLTKNRDYMDVKNYMVKSSSNLKLPLQFSIQNDISLTYNSGYSSDFKKSELLWNASLAKLILKSKGVLKLQCYDILKQRNNVMRVPAANYVSDTRTNMIGRYFMLSFIYKFNIFKGGSDTASNAETISMP